MSLDHPGTTQNPVPFTRRAGSTPASGTMRFEEAVPECSPGACNEFCIDEGSLRAVLPLRGATTASSIGGSHREAGTMSQIEDLFAGRDVQGLLDIATDRSKKMERRAAKERLCDLAREGDARAKEVCMQFFGIYFMNGRMVRTRRSW